MAAGWPPDGFPSRVEPRTAFPPDPPAPCSLPPSSAWSCPAGLASAAPRASCFLPRALRREAGAAALGTGDPHAQPEGGGGGSPPRQPAALFLRQVSRGTRHSVPRGPGGVEPPGWMARLPLGCLSYLIVHSVSLPRSRFTSHQMQSTVVASAQKWQFRGKG